MSDVAGRLFTWSRHCREEEFAEAYRGGIRAQIGDQEQAGLNILEAVKLVPQEVSAWSR
jgi:hypothetical protein